MDHAAPRQRHDDFLITAARLVGMVAARRERSCAKILGGTRREPWSRAHPTLRGLDQVKLALCLKHLREPARAQ